MSKTQALLNDREEFARQLASAKFRLKNIAATIAEDERVLASHRAMQLDAACECAAFGALVRAIDEELLELAQEAEQP